MLGVSGSIGMGVGTAIAATNPIGWGVLAVSGLTYLGSLISSSDKKAHNNRV